MCIIYTKKAEPVARIELATSSLPRKRSTPELHWRSWSGRRGSNPRPSAWKADALPTELLPQFSFLFGDFFVGFQSPVGHYRKVTPSSLTQPPRNPSKTNFDFDKTISVFSKEKPDRLFRAFSGRRWIRTTEGINQQIYSLPHLATLVFSQNS